MGIDALLDEPDYNLQSIHHLGWRDMDRLTGPFGATAPEWSILHLLRGRLVVRRKEVIESLFVLERLRPELTRARAVVEVGAGHGMVGLFAAALWPNLASIEQLDRRRPESWDRIRELLAPTYLRVKTAVRYREVRMERLTSSRRADLVFGVHLCGALTDAAAEHARAVGAAFAVVPCCESHDLLPPDLRVPGSDPEPVVNSARLARWRSWGYSIEERALPPRVTDRGRIFLATPPEFTRAALDD